MSNQVSEAVAIDQFGNKQPLKIVDQVTRKKTGDGKIEKITGTTKNDHIISKDSKDAGKKLIFAGAGDDTIESLNQGNDIYIWGKGHGNDVIIEKKTKGDHKDMVQMVGDITSEDIDYHMQNDKKGDRTLYIKIKSSSEFLTIPRDENPEAMYGIHFLKSNEKIFFNEKGLEYRARDIEEGSTNGDTLKGSSFLSTFIGSKFNDVIYDNWPQTKYPPAIKHNTYIGNKGNDVVYGGQGNNKFIWSPGDGNDTYYDQCISNKCIKSHIEIPLSAKQDLIYYSTNNGNQDNVLVIWHKSTNEYITVMREENLNTISAVKFSGGKETINLINDIEYLFDAYPPTQDIFDKYFAKGNDAVHEDL
ncbi:Ig family protein [endosymbiont of Acanthamoeba sp. UWC8]|uniref:hypothetical protein n=1 Tax=endosymbiont of Acanthamoeba sp. UWC8 TaxID=86106 RepID=UPI0004D13164|nr:hypothetical protein [endosymbiont of Acanthamoeba sp. UWC8]AIF81512.1 Ig family protein [endosymbiont of Acanthamoeba sp. UWC8]